MNTSINRRYLIHILLIIICIILIYSFLLFSSDFYRSLRWKAIDFLYYLQNIVFAPPQQLNQIVIIAIDDASLEKVPMRWPWERRIFAEILKKINLSNPGIIYLNFTLFGESKLPADDLSLSAVIERSGNIILPSYYDSGMKLVSPLEAFSSHALKVGFVNKAKDRDEVVRRFHPFYRTESGRIENYAVELSILSSLYNKKEKEIISKIPLLKDDSAYINYLASPDDFTVYSFFDVLTNKVDPSLLKMKVVLIGSTTEMIHDIHPTPIGNMPGIYLVANTFITIMSNRFLKEPKYFLSLILFVVLALAVGFLTFRYGISRGILVIILISISIFIISFFLFRQGIILDWLTPILVMVTSAIPITFVRYITILKMHMGDLERANIEIKNAQKEIVRREQLSTIGKLTSKIIHEINNPLGNMLDCIEILQEKIKEPGEIQKILDIAHQEATRAKKIGEELKTSYTPHVEEKIPTNINNLLLDIIETSGQRIKSKGIEIKPNLDDNLPLVPISPHKIKQVFLNMLLNAVDATESGKHIYISTKKSGIEWVDVIFKDEGCGISQEELGKIFEAFYTTRKHKNGTGLGLFISDEIIRAHKGKILVESTVGVGTTFTIKLPAKEQHEQ